jgi:hypothetical protein
MNLLRLLTAFVLMCAIGAGAAAQSEKQMTILKTFQITVANDKKPELKTGFIATERDWKRIWAHLNPIEELPAIDFTEHFLLVGTQDAADPNQQNTVVLKDDEGVVLLSGETTLIGFEPSDQTIYRFHKLTRAGVTGIRRGTPVRGEYPVDPLPKPK